MRAIPIRGLRPVAGKTWCQKIGTTSLLENDRPYDGLLRCQGFADTGGQAHPPFSRESAVLLTGSGVYVGILTRNGVV